MKKVLLLAGLIFSGLVLFGCCGIFGEQDCIALCDAALNHCTNGCVHECQGAADQEYCEQDCTQACYETYEICIRKCSGG